MVSGMCKSLLLLAAALRSDAVSAAEDFSAARSCPVETDFAKDLETTFVQKQLIVRSKLAEKKGERTRERERESEQAQLPSRIHWVHVAKTGSSFMSTLLQLDDPICKPGSGQLLNSENPRVKDVRTWCPGIMMNSNCSDAMHFDACSEGQIGDLELNAPRLVGFFRQPEVRIMSDFNKGCVDLGSCEPERTPKRHGQLVQGCTVKMLTHQYQPELFNPAGAYHCNDGIIEPPTWAQVDRALDRVQNEYVFIGMTDDWDLSICLFNAMFGNACHSSQFGITQPSHVSSTNSSDVSPLDGFVDVYDAVLWEAAQRIFQENLLRFNVSKEKCQPCWGTD